MLNDSQRRRSPLFAGLLLWHAFTSTTNFVVRAETFSSGGMAEILDWCNSLPEESRCCTTSLDGTGTASLEACEFDYDGTISLEELTCRGYDACRNIHFEDASKVETGACLGDNACDDIGGTRQVEIKYVASVSLHVRLISHCFESFILQAQSPRLALVKVPA